MITIDRPSTYSTTRLKSSSPIERRAVVEQHNDQREFSAPLVDRRKNRDRRRQRRGKILLESRSGKDRRKNTRSTRPSIDIKA